MRRADNRGKIMIRTSVPIIARGDAGLAKYLDEIHRFPILQKEEEFEYARAWRERGDKKAAEILVTSHLRLAAKMAIGYRGYGLALEDLVSEANLGLMRAVQGFDPDRGFRLATYAMWWIRASVQDYILRSWSLVKLSTSAARKSLFFNLRRTKKAIHAYEEGDLTTDHVRQIAERLKVSENDVIEMNRRLAGVGDLSLNTTFGHEEDAGEWQDWITDSDADQAVDVAEDDEMSTRRELLNLALKELGTRERDILVSRRLYENKTANRGRGRNKDVPARLDDLAKKHHVSRERIRQIEIRAFEKVQARVLEMAKERKMLPGGDETSNISGGSRKNTGNRRELIVDSKAVHAPEFAKVGDSLFRRDLLKLAMKEIKPRDRAILKARRMIKKPKTLDELSAKYGVSKGQIRRIEHQTYEKVQNRVEEMDPKQKMLPAAASAAGENASAS